MNTDYSKLLKALIDYNIVFHLNYLYWKLKTRRI